MTINLADLDAHEQPSTELRAEWKAFSRLDHSDLLSHPRIDDPRTPLADSEFKVCGSIPRSQIETAYSQLGNDYTQHAEADVPILHHPLLPSLLIVPSLVHPRVQETLLDRMVHRDLSNPKHLTNMHPHYEVPYPEGKDEAERSFFSESPDSPTRFTPKDPETHKPLSVKQVLQRRLHWVTLGGQYDWTNRVYPGEEPPVFPTDISRFLESLFPATLAQAAIVNFYTPGDTMMMHRDVSEESDKGLVSLSFGCDCLFMIAPSQVPGQKQPAPATNKDYLLLRLRSGDAIYMADESRYAWHGVPKVLKGTCPDYIEDWPAKNGKFGDWRGWMGTKRINLNVRQMKD